jgi:hypothetical protein
VQRQEINKVLQNIIYVILVAGILRVFSRDTVAEKHFWLFPTNFYICKKLKPCSIMFWTLELASHLEDAPWPATKDELIDYSIRSGAPIEVIENLQELDDEGEIYEGLDDIWPDYPSQEDFFFNEDEY